MSNEDNYNDAKLDRYLDDSAKAEQAHKETITCLKSELEDAADCLNNFAKSLVSELDEPETTKKFEDIIQSIWSLYDEL